MTCGNYKLSETANRKKQNSPVKGLYTIDELEAFTLLRLQEICKYENIKTPSIRTLQNREELIKIIYRYLGTEKQILINQYDVDACTRLEELLLNEEKQLQVEVQIPSRIRLFKDIGTLDDKDNKYEITISGFTPGDYVLLVDPDNRIQAILTLEQSGFQRYQLDLVKKRMSKGLKIGNFLNMSLVFFPVEMMEAVIRIYHNMKRLAIQISYVRRTITELLIEEAPIAEEILVIDYGTSYTTAGIFNGSTGRTERVKFHSDESYCSGKIENSPCSSCDLCPSVIAVKSCKENKIEFIFGYNAVKEEKDRGYVTKSSIFYDAKRWIYRYRETVQVFDFEGNTCEIERSLILHAFLSYIIKTAEKQNKVRYKKIYMTCPVKQKSLSLKMYQEVMPDYQVITEHTIDEAVAVVYHSLADEITSIEYDSGETKHVLIIDCGGGTSDMVQCDYTITDKTITSQVDMCIRYAHGNTNFGGDNLTYRILQYLKIRFAEYYAKEPVMSIGQLLSDVLYNYNLYEYIDENGVDQAYEAISKRYEWSETIIPTYFYKYKNATETAFLKIKGNYYFLWHLAERVKRELYQQNGIVFLLLQQLYSTEPYTDTDFYHLSVKNAKGMLDSYTICPEIMITKEEIDLLLKPDIYNLLHQFIEPHYQEGNLEQLDQIYLSGQSSKIDLFREVLKEYVAGKKAKENVQSSCVRKFMCIDGAITFYEAKKVGMIRPTIQYEPALIPYHLVAPNFQKDEREKYLIYAGTSISDVYGYISRPVEAEKIVFTLMDKDLNILNRFEHEIKKDEREESNYGQILKEYPIIKQEDIDNMEDGELKLFLFSENESWGFSVLEIERSRQQLYYRKPKYYPFENTGWEIDFFDGLH